MSIINSLLQQLVFREETEHAISFFQCKRFPSLLLCGLIRSFKEIYNQLPNLEEIVIYQYEPCTDTCEYVVPIEDAIPILIHGIIEYGTILTCRVIYLFYTFSFTENRYPRIDELEGTNDIISQQVTDTMYQNVDEFWNTVSSGINIDNLEKKVLDEKHTEPCAICQEDMDSGQEVMTLPCQHMFHTKSDTCSGIEEWISKIDTCPLCKKKI